ncbi:MarR family winged helix-turn-helix transcriptional regulator [Paenibacillus macerans]|uniref:MarR family winged helix-turn-helix transcriptional regulator n=1 Tax=Paenibacillus macerans TaxID=44252 RepID=UPI003D315480
MAFDLDSYIERIELAWSNTFRKMKSELMYHQDLGLTGPQFHMLALIARKKTCNVSYLADKLEVKPSAITVMIDRLVQSGYVERRHDEQDRRAVLLSVTDRGAEVFEEAKKKSREVLKSHLSVLDQHELDVLIRIIEKFAKAERT